MYGNTWGGQIVIHGYDTVHGKGAFDALPEDEKPEVFKQRADIIFSQYDFWRGSDDWCRNPGGKARH